MSIHFFFGWVMLIRNLYIPRQKVELVIDIEQFTNYYRKYLRHYYA